MKRTSLTITAYKCRICVKRRNEDLLTMEEEFEQGGVDLERILTEYVDNIRNPQIGKNSNRSIGLKQPLSVEEIDDFKKISIYTEAGKLGEDFTVVDHSSLTRTQYSGDTNAAMYSQRTYCFIHKATKQNIFIFFRFGLGGCKTAFQETLNQFLASKQQIAHFDVQLSPVMLEDSSMCIPEKLSLQTHFEISSTDAAENMRGKSRRKLSQETIIYLDSPKAKNIVELLKNRLGHKPSLEELRSITIADNYGNFDEANLTLKIGKASRKINFEDFTGTLADYDITDKVEYYDGGKKFKEESLDSIINEYAFSFFDA